MVFHSCIKLWCHGALCTAPVTPHCALTIGSEEDNLRSQSFLSFSTENIKGNHFSIFFNPPCAHVHTCTHTQTLLQVFTCYELERMVVSRISTERFLDFVGCQVKQIQVILHRKVFLEAIFESDITCTKLPHKIHPNIFSPGIKKIYIFMMVTFDYCIPGLLLTYQNVSWSTSEAPSLC